MTLPKQFIVDDLGLELAHTLSQLQTLRRKMDATNRTVEAQRKRLDALRKRFERSKAREQKLRECKEECEEQAQRPLEGPANHEDVSTSHQSE